MYITNPEDMWVGRSFIDYVMSEDQPDFCREITNKISVPLCQMSIRLDQAGSEDQKVHHYQKHLIIHNVPFRC